MKPLAQRFVFFEARKVGFIKLGFDVYTLQFDDIKF